MVLVNPDSGKTPVTSVHFLTLLFAKIYLALAIFHLAQVSHLAITLHSFTLSIQ